MQSPARCRARLRNGKSCQNPAKSVYNGYCGVHKNYIEEKKAKEIGPILKNATLLILLCEKAVEYLPHMIEVLESIRHLAFIFEQPPQFEPVELSGIDRFRPSREYSKEHGEDALIPFHLSPKDIDDQLKFMVSRADWRSLAELLSHSFDVQIGSGSVPPELLVQIKKTKAQLAMQLRDLGYEGYPRATLSHCRVIDE